MSKQDQTFKQYDSNWKLEFLGRIDGESLTVLDCTGDSIDEPQLIYTVNVEGIDPAAAFIVACSVITQAR